MSNILVIRGQHNFVVEIVINTIFISVFCRYAAIAVASKLSDMQLGESVDIGQLTKKEQKKARYTRKLKLACFY